MKEAMDVYLYSALADSIKIEKSLELTNRALELDDHSISALTHKTTLLFRKKDIDGLLQITDDLIKLRPENPHYLVQKALYLELKGDSSGTDEYYESALNEYQNHLKRDSLDLNLLLDYVGFLEVTGDTTTANETLTKMEKMNFDDAQKQIFTAYKSHMHKRQSFFKEVLIQYWKGEITYDQVEAKIEGK
jgi:tetratricopeptide (TPR) repeat protein